MRRWARALVALVAAGLLVGGGAAAVEPLLLPDGDGEVLTLLLLGSDEGPPRSADPRRGRADGFQLLFVAPDRQHATFVSLPRDSWVTIAGRGTDRINACLVGGPETCVRTVEQEFDLEVDGYLLTSMQAFKEAVRDFGGLEVDVPHALSDGGTDIPSAGVQRLTGSQALTYARDRKSRAYGDFDRTQAQAELLAIGHRTVAADGSIEAVLRAVTVLRRHTDTDLSGAELARLGLEALRLPPDGVERALAPGVNGWAGPAAVVRLQPEAYELVRDAADDGRLG